MSTPARGEEAGRRTAADLAASALLGALLWDPRRLHDVVDWLQPDDFRHWADRAIYQTLVGMLADGRPVDLLTLPGVLARAEYHDARVDRTGIGPLSAPALHSLLSMTPATPRAEVHEGRAHSEHVRYARLVLDDSIRRQVEAAGTRIGQYARHISGQDSASAAEGLTPVLTEAETRLRQLTERLGSAGSIRSAISAALTPTKPGNTSPGPELTDRLDAGQTRVEPTEAQLHRAEATLVGACVVSSDVRSLVEGRVLATDFTAPAIAATWHAMSALRQQHEPVDFVLAAAEVERQGKLPDLGRGLEPDQLARLAARFDRVSAYKAIETVVHAALTRAVHDARDQLQDLVSDRAQSSDEVLKSAQQTIGGVESTARRLTGTAPSRAMAALNPPADRIPAARPRPPMSAPAPAPIPTSREPQRRR